MSTSPRMSSADAALGKFRPTVAGNCVIQGVGTTMTVMARQTATFVIEARNAEGTTQQSGGDKFVVSVRGSSQTRAKVVDKEDGTYEVTYKPSTSGSYRVSVTLNGVSLPNSPFQVEVLTPAPDASKCKLSGDALSNAMAREIATFEIEFNDALGQASRAEELDVWVERADDGDEMASDVRAADYAPQPAAATASSATALPTGGSAARSGTRLPEGKLSSVALVRAGGRVEVGTKPLIMRADVELDSHLVSVLRPGQLVTVLAEHEMADSDQGDPRLRARVEVVEDDLAARAIAKSWWSAPSGPAGLDLPLIADVLESEQLATLGDRSSSPKGAQRGKSSGPVRGWVTLYKHGAELVAQRPRLNAGERRKHLELWARRDAADRAFKKSAESKNTNSHDRVQSKTLQVGPSLAHEIEHDAQGIAFAYGGIHPGTMHAGGKMVRSHNVRYSIGRSGKYKLHIGIRQQAISLPGSPFKLYVSPAQAHAPSTSLPADALPLKGVVGDDWSCSCTLFVSDKMGNRCVTGGAPIIADADSPDIQAQCTDNANGSYTLQWRGMVSGTYKTQVRIDGVHVIGSPTTIKMLSGPPDVSKCELAGSGLKTALAGQAATVAITCKDRYANLLNADSLSGAALSFGLALLNVGEGKATRDSVETMPFEGDWVKSEGGDGESFQIQYTAKEAGDFELHVWCNPDGSGSRQWLTGSPFTLRVTGVHPSQEGSFVERDGEGELEAGECVVCRPQLRDQFGNASAALEGTFTAHVDAPDGMHSLELKPLKGLGVYEVAYDVALKGPHAIHVLLEGYDICSSPVTFDVIPAQALGSKSKLVPPSEPPQINQPCELLVEAIDKFGNKLDKGGSRVDARANGPGVTPCTVDDRNDGTYTITFSSSVVGETRIIVRLDNVEMPPLKMLFVEGKGGGEGVKRGKGIKPGSAAAADAPAEAAPATDPETAAPASAPAAAIPLA